MACRWWAALLLVAIGWALVGGSAGAQVTEVRVGALLPLSGPDALDGENQRRAHDLAVDEINAQGGIRSLGGARLRMVYADSQGRPEVGIAETERLIVRERVAAIFGAFHSGVTVSATLVAERNRVPFIVPNALADVITERGLKYTFKTVTKISDFARDSGSFVVEMGRRTRTAPRRVAILYPDIFFGREVARAYRAILPTLGLDLAADVAYPSPATSQVESILRVRAASPDVVYLAGNISDATLTMRQLRETNYWPRLAVVAIGGGPSNPLFVQNVGVLGEGLFVVNDWFPNIRRPGSREVNERFRARYGVDMTGNANTTYAAMWIFKDALERAASTDGERLRQALAETDIRSGVPTFMYDRVKFDEMGQNPYAINVVAQIHQGSLAVVFPTRLAVRSPQWPVPGWDARR